MIKRLNCLMATAAVGFSGAIAVAQPPEPQPPAPQNPALRSADGEMEQQEGVEYLTRGPLHEAFATPYTAEAKAAELISKQPPEEIEELPPEYKPEGENITWIPGYWAWDEDASDFIWVSGLWREVPPGQRWIPGYWETEDNQYRWVSGFWVDETSDEVAYLPTPPETLERGPSSEAPDEFHFYIPGYWTYQTNDYKWVPGYWAQSQPGWVWIPVQYNWTPQGYVTTGGYWDYTLMNRGFVFTPVRYSNSVYTNPSYRYRPRYVLDTGESMMIHLFLNAASSRFFFGDYYNTGYQPWVRYYGNANYYDPMYTYYRVNAINGRPNVLQWIDKRNNYFASNTQYRPPRTIAQQRKFLQDRVNATDPDFNPDYVRAATIADELEAFSKRNRGNFQFQPLNRNAAENIRDQYQDFEQQLRRQRLAKLDPDASLNASGQGQANANRGNGQGNGQSKANINGNAQFRGKTLKLPGMQDRRSTGLPPGSARNADGEPWLSQEEIARAKAETRNMRSNSEISQNALENLGDQTREAREYWEDMRRAGRVRPMASDDWPARENPPRINKLPPKAHVQLRPNLSSNRGATAQGDIRRVPDPKGRVQGRASATNNLGSGNNSGSGNANSGATIIPKGNPNRGAQGKRNVNRGNSGNSGGKARGNSGAGKGKGKGKG